MVSMGLPTIDGDFIAGYGSLAIKAGRFVKVPILTGVVANEGTNFIPRRVKDWEDVSRASDWCVHPAPLCCLFLRRC